jgi:hypothetical protein
VRLELTTYRLTAGRAADCAIQELVAPIPTHPANRPAENLNTQVKYVVGGGSYYWLPDLGKRVQPLVWTHFFVEL